MHNMHKRERVGFLDILFAHIITLVGGRKIKIPKM